jgi:hypothetical protein
MSARAGVLAIVFALALRFPAEPQPPLYSAVEADKFIAARGVAFPADYQTALREDIAREISIAFPTVFILRPGDAPPDGPEIEPRDSLLDSARAPRSSRRLSACPTHPPAERL